MKLSAIAHHLLQWALHASPPALFYTDEVCFHFIAMVTALYTKLKSCTILKDYAGELVCLTLASLLANLHCELCVRAYSVSWTNNCVGTIMYY